MNADHHPPDQWTRDLDLITTAAMAAGEKALTYFRKNPEFRYKNEDRSPVSEADYAANDILKERLLSARPNYGWLSEETDDDEARLGCDTVFVVDPIDGTRGFIAGKDVWCVSVAVVHKGRPVAGVLYAPALIELYQARHGAEARRNGVTIHVAKPVAGQSLRFAIAEDLLPKLKAGYGKDVARVSHVPSLAYRIAMIADGQIDGTVVKKNAHDWDLAAADLILQQAGGVLTGLDGEPLTYNRPSVRHDVLCAAALPALPALLDASAGLHGH
ncbi:myo-inositol-1(or 4)-monophosphatase [Rhizobium sp. PP-F2F-G36]|nr:myo-inositol-1(or 4)-monophosphatase [Rhizobium sp. PP-F2F-G36]